MFKAGEGGGILAQILQEESCGWPAQGDLCGAAHRHCASALLTHSGAGELPAGHWKIPGKISLSDRDCLLRAVSLLHCHLAATAGSAEDLRLLTGWQITFEKRICQFSSVRSSLLSAAPRAVHPTARLCSPVLPQVPALGELPWHTCPNHTLLELCSDARPVTPPEGLWIGTSPGSLGSACSSFPGFSLSSLTLQAASFCWQHPHSFLLTFVS